MKPLDLSGIERDLIARHGPYGFKSAVGGEEGAADKGRENRVADKLDAVKAIGEVNAALEQRDEEIKRVVATITGDHKKSAAEIEEAKKQLSDLAKGGTELQARLLELEQKMARRGGASDLGVNQPKSWGSQFAEKAKDRLSDIRTGGSKARVEMDTKATITLATTGSGGVGNMIRPERLPGVILPPNRPLVVRDLLLPGRTNSNAIEYARETGFTNNAATVAETAQKPQSDLTVGLMNSPVRTIAHWFLASVQVLDDVPMLESYIDARARYGLAFAEEQQLLLGDGTGVNLNGIIPQATAYSQAETGITGVNRMDRIRNAMLQSMLSLYRPSAIVMNPADWAVIELTKDSQGRYIWANPMEQGVPRLWGLPVVESLSMAAGSWLVGAFNMAAQIFDRQDVTVELSTEDSDNFRKNLVTIRAEERLALAVYRPAAFVTGNFTFT